jgi:DNA-binding NarL/FixJ family response regulator
MLFWSQVSSRCLLVVDADPAVHQFLAGLLQREDRTIQDAYDGHEALEYLRNARYDLVVAGQGGNSSDGLTLLRRAATVCPTAKVIVTGEPDPRRIVRAVRHHAYGYFHKPLPPGPIAEMVQQALEATSWRDDIKVISARPEWFTMDVRCKLDAADRATHFVREMEADLSPKKRDDVVVAFRELLLNAIEHGGKSDPSKRVRFSLIRTGRQLIGQIQDPGPGFSLDTLPHAAISNPDGSPIRHVEVRAEQGQRPGGFGILMTRSLVDDLVYNERGNSVLFTKAL